MASYGAIESDTSTEPIIIKKIAPRKKGDENNEVSVSLTKTRVIMTNSSRWVCGCIVKQQDRSYWLSDVSNIVLDTSPFKPVSSVQRAASQDAAPIFNLSVLTPLFPTVLSFVPSLAAHFPDASEPDYTEKSRLDLQGPGQLKVVRHRNVVPAVTPVVPRAK